MPGDRGLPSSFQAGRGHPLITRIASKTSVCRGVIVSFNTWYGTL